MMELEIYQIIVYILLFVLGAALASFYNATIYRIEKEITFPKIATENSFCEGCKKPLTPIQLIPILGYLIYRGRCPECGFKVNPLYPISEFILGISFVLLAFYDAEIKYFVLLNFLYFLALYDYSYKGFSSVIMHIFLGISSIFFLYEFFFKFDKNLTVLIVSGSIIAAIILLNLFKQSFGTGDLLVILMISFYVSLSQFVATILFSILLAGFFSVFLLLFKKASRKDAIPFVPFIYFAFLITFPLQHYISGYFASFLYLW